MIKEIKKKYLNQSHKIESSPNSTSKNKFKD